VSLEEKETRVFARLKTRTHSRSFSVPGAGLFSEPFLRDLDLLWSDIRQVLLLFSLPILKVISIKPFLSEIKPYL